MSRPVDRIRLEGAAGSFIAFNSLVVTNDITAPSEASFDIGDDGSWSTLAPVVAHGKPFKVFLNDRLRLTGRIESRESPTSASGGSVIKLVVRTKLSDARYASADPKTRVENVSIKQFLLKLFAALGYTEADFVFSADAERNIMTGVGARGATPPILLEPLKADQAKVNPPETIYDAASRHLKRHGLMLWDTPDGKIYVGKPDDGQQPIYMLRLRRGASGAGNNLLSATRIQDYSDAPSRVTVHSYTGGVDTERIPVKGQSVNQEIIEAGLMRDVILQAEQARNLQQANAQAKRERASRSKRLDAFDLAADGWAYWTGFSSIPYATNTTADLMVDTVGGPQGRYYLHRVTCSLDTGGAQKTTMQVSAPGVWEI